MTHITQTQIVVVPAGDLTPFDLYSKLRATSTGRSGTKPPRSKSHEERLSQTRMVLFASNRKTFSQLGANPMAHNPQKTSTVKTVLRKYIFLPDQYKEWEALRNQLEKREGSSGCSTMKFPSATSYTINTAAASVSAGVIRMVRQSRPSFCGSSKGFLLNTSSNHGLKTSQPSA